MPSVPERGKIRLGVVIPFYHPVFGGAENQCRALLRTLRATGEVEVPFLLTRRKRRELPRQEMVDGVPVLRLGPPGDGRWAHYGFYLALFWRLLGKAREAEVLHCHATAATGLCVTLAGRLRRRPVVLKLSTNGELWSPAVWGRGVRGRVVKGLKWLLGRFLCRHATIVVLNGEGAEEVRSLGGRRPRLIPNGVDTARFRPAPERKAALRDRFGLPRKAVLVLFTGRFTARKGLDLLVAAYERCGDRPPLADTVLCLVGSGRGQAEPVNPLLPGHRRGQVRHLAPLPDLEAVLQAADVFVFPSRREGLPNAVLEALAAGLPCVLSDIAPHRELAARNPRAVIRFFPSGDAEALARELGAACREPAPQPASQLAPEFRLDAVAGTYLELYRELCHGRS